MSNRKEKKEENREGTQTRKHPNGYPQLEVFEKAAFEKREVRRNCNRHCVLSSCANAVQARCQLTFTCY
jgi:hypothetical protein